MNTWKIVLIVVLVVVAVVIARAALRRGRTRRASSSGIGLPPLGALSVDDPHSGRSESGPQPGDEHASVEASNGSDHRSR